MSSRTITRWTFRGAIVAAAIGLAGCTNPYSPGQRAAGGGLIGAGAGSIIGAAAGNAGAGALIGAAAGAAGGALTTPQRPRYGGGYNDGYNNGSNQPPPGYSNNPPPRY